MSLVDDDVTCGHISELPAALLRHRPSRKKICYSIMNISEDQLYEEKLKSGEVVL